MYLASLEKKKSAKLAGELVNNIVNKSIYLKTRNRELVKGSGAFLAGGCVQVQGTVQRRFGGPFVCGLLDRPIRHLAKMYKQM